MCLRFTPLLQTLQVLTERVTITKYVFKFQTTIADFTITSQNYQFWRNNNKIWV